MRDMFFYRRVIGEGDKQKKVWDAFNVNKVIRVMANIDGSAIILLDDGHEESIVVGVDQKNKQEKRERKWFDSQIGLLPEDYSRFILNVSIDEISVNLPPLDEKELPKAQPVLD